MQYYIWAEHTCGQSVGHPCTDGAVEDPADKLDIRIVDAASEDAAAEMGFKALGELCSQYQHCPCGKTSRVGNEAWWNSVSIIASREPYPSYVGDE